MRRSLQKILRRSLLIPLALLFIAEAWLWEKTGAFVRRLIDALPFARLLALLRARIEGLSPLQTLSVFIVPVLVLLPFKFFALWLLAKGFFLSGILSIFGAKLAGLGVTSFLFTLCKPKLLKLRWLNWLYIQCLHWRAVAERLVRPYTRFIGRYRRALAHKGPLRKLLAKLRARMHKARGKL